jgi:hypothetical protein
MFSKHMMRVSGKRGSPKASAEAYVLTFMKQADRDGDNLIS